METGPQINEPMPAGAPAPQTPVPAAAPNLLTDRVFLVVLTAVSYLCAYAREIGWSAVFNYPRELITISVQDLIMTGTTFLCLSALVLQPLFHYAQFRDAGLVNDTPMLIRLVLLVLKKYVLFIIMSIYIMWSGLYEGMWLIVAFLLMLIFEISMPLIARRPGMSYRDDLAAMLSKDGPYGWTPSLKELLWPSVPVRMALISLAIVMVSYGIGRREALSKRTFMIVTGEKELILRRFGDQCLLAGYDASKKAILPVFRLVPITDLKEGISEKEIGFPAFIKPEPKQEAKGVEMSKGGK